MTANEAKWYQMGYRGALSDLLYQLDKGGEDAAREWITNNLPEPEVSR